MLQSVFRQSPIAKEICENVRPPLYELQPGPIPFHFKFFHFQPFFKMERSEAHLFEEDDDEMEERNGEDIEGELFGPRSDDGSESPGSLNDFIDEEEATPIDILAYAAFDASREETLPTRRRRRVVVSSQNLCYRIWWLIIQFIY